MLVGTDPRSRRRRHWDIYAFIRGIISQATAQNLVPSTSQYASMVALSLLHAPTEFQVLGRKFLTILLLYRYTSLTIYCIASIPFLNVVLAQIILTIPTKWIHWSLRKRHSLNITLAYSRVACTALLSIMVVIVISTEQVSGRASWLPGKARDLGPNFGRVGPGALLAPI